MSTFSKTLRAWIPAAVVITGLSLMVYVVAQQEYRSALNDPQLQIALDAKSAVEAGTPIAAIVPAHTSVDIAKSLSPFIGVYDEAGTVIASTATLGGEQVNPPSGIFDMAREQGDNLPHNTWQPALGVRVALVVEHIAGKDGGFVVVGRSMQEGERRIDEMGQFVLLAWGCIMVASFAVKYLMRAL